MKITAIRKIEYEEWLCFTLPEGMTLEKAKQISVDDCDFDSKKAIAGNWWIDKTDLNNAVMSYVDESGTIQVLNNEETEKEGEIWVEDVEIAEDEDEDEDDD